MRRSPHAPQVKKYVKEFVDTQQAEESGRACGGGRIGIGVVMETVTNLFGVRKYQIVSIIAQQSLALALSCRTDGA